MRRATPLALLVLTSILAIVVPAADPIVTGGPVVSGDLAWMMTASGLVLLMTPGLSFFYGGMVQKKNVISTMLQSLMAMVVISIVWVVFGFSLAFGDDIGGHHRRSADLLHVPPRRQCDTSRAGSDHSAGRCSRCFIFKFAIHHAGVDSPARSRSGCGSGRS
jgi:ammonia channel protein AmtB